MSIGVLDINDSNLQLWHEGTTVQSPGYVLFQEKEYRFGSPARAAARFATAGHQHAVLVAAEHRNIAARARPCAPHRRPRPCASFKQRLHHEAKMSQ